MAFAQVNSKTFDMLEDKSRTKKFTNWLEASGNTGGSVHAHRGAMRGMEGGQFDTHGSAFLPLLRKYYQFQENTWQQISHDHMLSFLMGSWKQRVYWWDVVTLTLTLTRALNLTRTPSLMPTHLLDAEQVEVFRRLGLSGILVLFGPGTRIQSGCAIMICILSIQLYSLYQPFREDDDNFLQALHNFQLFFVILASVLDRMISTSVKESNFDRDALGYLLIAFVVPGYRSETKGGRRKLRPKFHVSHPEPAPNFSLKRQHRNGRWAELTMEKAAENTLDQSKI